VAEILTATRAHAAFILRPSGERALANVLRIAELARQWEASGGISFRGFVERLAEEAEGEASEAPVVEEGSEGVRMMTVHRAKGLEFPVVILADISANAAAQNPGRYIDGVRGLCALRLTGWSPWDLLDHEVDERARDRTEGARVAYVAATRARDLLVVPAIGDDPFAGGWEAAPEGWIEPVQRALYPPSETRRASEPADGCPPFGQDSVLNRTDRDVPDQANVTPGLHLLGGPAAGYSVVWWDPHVLALDVEPQFGIPRQDLIEDPGPEVLAIDRLSYRQWQESREDTRERGSRPSFAVQTVTEWSQRRPEHAAVSERDVALVDVGTDISRPGGRRFGTLVHAVLAAVPLDASSDAIAEVAALQSRILGAPPEETAAAATLTAAALAHPLLERARAASRQDRCRRETPITSLEPDGTMLEGVLDLAFEESEGWTVVDFKTQTELAGSLAAYRRQVLAYASVVARTTGRPATAVLLRL
jgi:ATP-dependent exoDNAse (exonuclease V) beta subunit